MNDDWSVLTDERRASLVKALFDLRDTYVSANLSLNQFLVDTAETIATKSRDVSAIIRKLDDAKPDDADEGLPIAETRPDGLVQLRLSQEQLDLMQRAMVNTERMYESHPQLRRDMAFIYAFALYDGLLADVAYTTLVHIPGRLKTGREITYKEALAFPSREALIQELASRETFVITQRSAVKQLEYFQEQFHIDPLKATGVTVETLASVAEDRNLLVHNNGIVTAEHVRKTRSSAAIGTRLQLSEDEMKERLAALESVGLAVVSGCGRKISKKAIPSGEREPR